MDFPPSATGVGREAASGRPCVPVRIISPAFAGPTHRTRVVRRLHRREQLGQQPHVELPAREGEARESRGSGGDWGSWW